jgi:hypothetical protein
LDYPLEYGMEYLKMKYQEIKTGMMVRDKWFTDGYTDHRGFYHGWGLGKVIKKLKTVVYIYFVYKGIMEFDIPHLQFLEKA